MSLCHLFRIILHTSTSHAVSTAVGTADTLYTPTTGAADAANFLGRAPRLFLGRSNPSSSLIQSGRRLADWLGPVM